MRRLDTISLKIFLPLHLLLVHVTSISSKRIVLRSTPFLEQQGFVGDVDLGEVVEVRQAASQDQCQQMCQQQQQCVSTLFSGQLCTLLSSGYCEPQAPIEVSICFVLALCS